MKMRCKTCGTACKDEEGLARHQAKYIGHRGTIAGHRMDEEVRPETRPAQAEQKQTGLFDQEA